MCNNDIPDERLRVFISSAQSNEGIFAWRDVRRRIKNYLKTCPYINPFIIEDVASPSQSVQFYQRQLLKADIVVLLVKGEVRKGTATEYALATKHKKPMLIYFLDDGSLQELSAVSLKRDIQENDYCTYRSMSSFDDIEKVVLKNVIESVICYFQDMPYHGVQAEDATEAMSLPYEVQESKYSVPTKTAIALFSSCYGHIFDLLGLPQVKGEDPSELSVLHDLGLSALDWLVTGQTDISDKAILDLIDNVSDIYSETNWLSRRWDAIRHEMAGDIEGALIAESEALSLARASEMPPWIVANILIDCRNIENEVFARDGNYFFEGTGQKALNELDTIVYLPVLDRYLGNIYGALANETEKFNTANPGTIFMGTNIGGIINDVENYFFSAILYGSYSHMLIARDLLAKVLYQYDELTGKEPLLFEYMKLLVLRGNAKKFKKIIEHRWDDAYFSITSSADVLWQLTDRVPIASKDAMKCAVLTKLGMYMSDECFSEAEIYLQKIVGSVNWQVSENFFECIYQNINRLNPVVVTEMLTDIIRERRFHIGRKLADIMLYLNLENVSYNLQLALCEAIKGSLNYIVSNGGHPHFIAALVMQNREVFEVLAFLPDNGLHGTEKLFYDINTGNGSWNDVVTNQIEVARGQFEANNNSNVYHGFFEKPYATIKNAIREYYTNEMAIIINDKFIPLCIEVLRSQVPADVKDECIDCLCDILVYSNPGDVVLTDELVATIENIDVSAARTVMGNSVNSLACRVLMLRIITGKADMEEMLEWCFDFAKKDRPTKVALAECLEQYLRRYADDPTKTNAMVLSIVLQCFEDDYWPVRKRACNCMAKMLTTRFKERVEHKLFEGAIDPSHYVRNHLLRMCKACEITDTTISERITDILKNDANYVIRKYANS